MFTNIASQLFDSSSLTPHGFCLLWQPGLIWTHALSDMGIGCAYFSIPAALAIVARRRKDLMFRPVFWLFAAFIMLCGTTHWLGLLTLWVPAYWLDGVVKAMTAVVSIVTAVLLWRLLPQALALPSPAQLREANEALGASEARHRAGFERSPVPVHTIDATGRVTGVSDSWLAWLGYERAEVVGRLVSDFQPVGPNMWTAAAMQHLLTQGEVRDIERRFRKRDGSTVDALVSARTENNGADVWAVCVLIDVTARRRAEKALQASQDQLHQAQKMEAVGQLTGGIAHDFNNLLQGMRGSLDLTERRLGKGEAERALHYLGVLRQALDRAAGLTQRLLAFARRQALRPASTSPDALILGLEELIRHTVGPNIRISLCLEDGRWPALCDPHQLESALINLSINARDAMPEGGNLVVSTADRTLTRADLHPGDEIEPGDFVEIAVTDDGHGMAPDVVSRAFEPFFTTKPVGQGTGLGLSQLYGFVRQSGGVVRIESAPGRGTSVRMLLPRCRLSQEEMVRPERISSASPARRPAAGHVLVVDDEPAIRAQICETLREHGFQVREAADGTAGLKAVRAGLPLDVLVTDVGLPGMNGRQLAEAARQGWPDLPVLLITGYAGTALDNTQLPSGMQLLRKPFGLDVLTEKVRAALETATVS